MECTSLIQNALKQGDISAQLFHGSLAKELITDLQRTLFELGFQKQLKWDKYQADGKYGSATTNAVLAFAEKNRIQTDGLAVTNEMAKILLQRHDFLPSMYLLWEIHDADLRSKKWFSKGTRMSIIAIQVLMNDMNYGPIEEDGIYTDALRNTLIKFSLDNNVQSDGDLVSRPLANLLLNTINKYYGKNWSDLAINHLPGEGSPLVYYEGSRFRGKPCRADKLFVPMLKKVNEYADAANVFIYVTSSFRTTTNVRGAIVKPATKSNHLAGHGIDMNVIYGNNLWANSSVLAQYPNVPAPVQKLLKSIIDDPDLRWGGLFQTKDPVHIDDGLNKKAGDIWEKRYELMQRAVQLGK